MSDMTANDRNPRGEWSPAEAIALAPINAWPPKPAVTFKWMFGFPGFLWPHNAFWLCISLITWNFLTPDLASMQSLELWWVALIFARNFVFILALFGGLHLYLYVFKGQGDDLKFTTKPFAKDDRKFIFKDQVHDNMFRTLASAVPVITGYEVLTYWLFANGYLGFFDFGGNQVLFWAWFGFALLLAPVVHAIHFYGSHRLLHIPFLYKRFHVMHHHNIEVGPWSGLAMHPVEHILYLSTVCVMWLVALHPVNMLFQLHLTSFYPALGHCGFEKLKIGKKLGIEGGTWFHYLHHKHFECNYGGSLAPLDNWFGTFHDGTAESHAKMRDRMRARREANREN